MRSLRKGGGGRRGGAEPGEGAAGARAVPMAGGDNVRLRSPRAESTPRAWLGGAGPVQAGTLSRGLRLLGGQGHLGSPSRFVPPESLLRGHSLSCVPRTGSIMCWPQGWGRGGGRHGRGPCLHEPGPGLGRQPLGHRLPKRFIGTRPPSLVFAGSVSALRMQQRSRAVATETVWPAKTEIFTLRKELPSRALEEQTGCYSAAHGRSRGDSVNIGGNSRRVLSTTLAVCVVKTTALGAEEEVGKVAPAARTSSLERVGVASCERRGAGGLREGSGPASRGARLSGSGGPAAGPATREHAVRLEPTQSRRTAMTPEGPPGLDGRRTRGGRPGAPGGSVSVTGLTAPGPRAGMGS